MTLRTRVLAIAERVRRIPGRRDLRQWRTYVVVTTWSGARVGLGSPTTTETELLVSGYPPRVQEVSSKDVVASGGRFASGDLRVGPITPQHATGGIDPGVYDPAVTNSPREVLFKLTGPSLPAEGMWCERVTSETLRNFTHVLVLRQTSRRP